MENKKFNPMYSCAKEHPELYTGSMCMKCGKDWINGECGERRDVRVDYSHLNEPHIEVNGELIAESKLIKNQDGSYSLPDAEPLVQYEKLEKYGIDAIDTCSLVDEWKDKIPSTGVELIAEERREQIEKHGYDVLDDREYNEGDQLVDAAMYAITGEDKYYPNNWGEWWRSKMVAKTNATPHSKIERLKIAGALLAAEIDRLKNNA